jgi:hypothetical protein
MTDGSEVPLTTDAPKGPPPDKSWLEVENVRGGRQVESAGSGESPVQADTGTDER